MKLLNAFINALLSLHYYLFLLSNIVFRFSVHTCMVLIGTYLLLLFNRHIFKLFLKCLYRLDFLRKNRKISTTKKWWNIRYQFEINDFNRFVKIQQIIILFY